MANSSSHMTLIKQVQDCDDMLLSNCTILIVDDCEIDRFTYRRYLESAPNLNWQIVDCESAEEALDLCNRDCPDLILLDYQLPATNGLELLQDLTQRLGKLPVVIMLTGQGNEAVAVEAMKLGVQDYLIKGDVTSQTLINAVTNALTERKLQAQIDRQKQQRELLAKIALQISNALELSQILQATVEGTRQLLDCDRTLVYRLNPDLSGTIVAEAILPAWTATLDLQIEDNCFQGDLAVHFNKYLQGHKMVVSDIESANLTPCHLQMLQQFEVKSILVVPIIVRAIAPVSEPKVWGLLIAHHCKNVHEWQADELTLLDELSLQIAIAIQQSELVADLQATIVKYQASEHQLQNRVVEIEQINLLLSRSTNLLEDRNQELDDFSHIASHDLQAPLRGISNLAEWLVSDLEGKLPVENQQQLQLIQSRVIQMNTLINGLLQYARVGRENVDSISVNLSSLLAEVVDLLDPPTEFQIQFPTNLPTIDTQVLLLKQVLSNLIGNAIKYHNRPNGKVEILLEDYEDCLHFKVIDDGPGIAPENHKKIFSIFQTLVSREDLKGTGIGLTIVKKIVESRGGSVWVESDLGRGSTFSFTWPKTYKSL
jgi:signal transduction histidine kinase/DNA-binding NarL/FixJ family response regulator